MKAACLACSDQGSRGLLQLRSSGGKLVHLMDDTLQVLLADLTRDVALSWGQPWQKRSAQSCVVYFKEACSLTALQLRDHMHFCTVCGASELLSTSSCAHSLHLRSQILQGPF